jgi:2-polyprenyl-3-methyl-5-hydroxy-6-metoxy-1,4-benzoquinol methylase
MKINNSSKLFAMLFNLMCKREYMREEDDDYDNKYFLKGLEESEKYFKKFGIPLNMNDKTILDVGCGYGSTSILLAQLGANKVIGIDIDSNRISFANKKLRESYPELLDKVKFCFIEEMGDDIFDCIIFKDSFEHIKDPDKYLIKLKSFLKEDGHIFIGFGPLWKSPYGGHIHYLINLPWAHLLFPEEVIIQAINKISTGKNIISLEVISGGLNKMTYKKFTNIIKKQNLSIVSLKTNVTDKKGMLIKVINLLKKIPFLKEYFTFNIYCVLSKKP